MSYICVVVAYNEVIVTSNLPTTILSTKIEDKIVIELFAEKEEEAIATAKVLCTRTHYKVSSMKEDLI